MLFHGGATVAARETGNLHDIWRFINSQWTERLCRTKHLFPRDGITFKPVPVKFRGPAARACTRAHANNWVMKYAFPIFQYCRGTIYLLTSGQNELDRNTIMKKNPPNNCWILFSVWTGTPPSGLVIESLRLIYRYIRNTDVNNIWNNSSPPPAPPFSCLSMNSRNNF